MSNESNHNFKDFLSNIVIAVVSAWVAAYLSVSYYGERIEKVKAELSFEQKLLENQLNVTSRLFEKSGILFQNVALYRSVELFEKVSQYKKLLPPEVVKLLKTINATQVTEESIITDFKEFQASLFSSKPFISEKVFEKLAVFGAKLNKLIFNSSIESETMHEIYASAGSDYNEAVELIKKSYSLKRLNGDS